MQQIKKFIISLLTITTLSLSLSSCEFSIEEFLPFPEQPSIEAPSEEENPPQTPPTDNGDEAPPSSDNTENIPPIEDEVPPDNGPTADQLLVDKAYELSKNEEMLGTQRLTGTVSEIDLKKSSYINLYMEVAGREDKPIYCYRLTGSGFSDLKVGDVITVEGKIKNYENIYIEFEKGKLVDSGSTTPPTILPDVSGDPYKNVTEWEFYLNYTPATSNEDAYYRSLHGFMSGSLTVPDQAPTISSYRPKNGTKFIRNNQMLFNEDNTAYTVVNAYGEKAFEVYRDGAYITLEEVAAYVYAFGTYPKNHTTSKDTDPSDSIWGEYLRLNHTKFSGDTKKYPYEPVLPNITGCGGTLTYYEMDVGTTGTDCDDDYPCVLYNNGSRIERGAARIVYGKNDLDRDGVLERGEFHLFYTYNHYNDFQEYLNYQGGWGEMFGNITGGGEISSKSDYNPTKYVEVSLQALPAVTRTVAAVDFFFYEPKNGCFYA